MSDIKVLNALYREQLSAFTRKTFETVTGGDAFMDNWHLHAIAHRLTQCAKGDVKRLIITIPPRSLKSITASVAFPAWLLGHDPTRKILCLSYAQDLAAKHSLDTRKVMESSWYQKAFMQTRLSQEKNTQSEFQTTKQGYRLASSVGGSLTGLGGDMIIIDDPHKADEAQSDIKREAVLNWYRNTLLSRLNNKQTGVIILIQQRLHENDLAGYLLETGEWVHLNLSAIAEKAETIPTGSNTTHQRHVGDVLHPEKEPLSVLNELKSQMGSYAFAAQYQQRPAPLGGGIVQWEWFKGYNRNNLKIKSGDQIVQSWDIATGIGEMNDWSVCTTWLMSNKEYFLLDLFRKRLEFPGLQVAVKKLADKYDPNQILIEAPGSGISLIQQLRSTTHLNIYAVQPKGDKKSRMMEESPAIEANKVRLPKGAPWLAEFQREIVQFPNSKHDDQVDSVSQFLRYARHRQPSMQQLQCTITPVYADYLIWISPEVHYGKNLSNMPEW